jgi:hypothetical protein
MTDVRDVYVLQECLFPHPFTWLYRHPVSAILFSLIVYISVDRIQEQSNSKSKSINVILMYESLQMARGFRTMGGLFGMEEQSFAQESGVTTLDPMEGRPLCANSTFLSS